MFQDDEVRLQLSKHLLRTLGNDLVNIIVQLLVGFIWNPECDGDLLLLYNLQERDWDDEEEDVEVKERRRKEEEDDGDYENRLCGCEGGKVGFESTNCGGPADRNVVCLGRAALPSSAGWR